MRYVTASVEETLGTHKMAFIAGPRQVGKTTVAKALLSSPGGYFNWDSETQRRAILRNPDGFWGDAPRVVLDEIHKYPRWKRFVKGLWDLHRDRLDMIVTGSGRLDVYQKGGDSLLGRYELHRLHPFTVGELLRGGKQVVPPPGDLEALLVSGERVRGAAEALEQIERFTGFPEPLHAASDQVLRRWRRTRRELVLREDLRDLTRIRDLGLIDQLVALLPERIGSPLSINALREDLGVAFNTAQGWLQALGRLYFLFELRPFAGRLARTLRREGKIYLFDPSEIDAPGPRFENVVALHLLKLVDAWNDAGHGDFALHYVRDKERREVDFLITDRRKPFWLVEAKLTDEDISPALRYFHERLGTRKTFQLVRTGSVRRHGDLLVLPADRALAHI